MAVKSMVLLVAKRLSKRPLLSSSPLLRLFRSNRSVQARTRESTRAEKEAARERSRVDGAMGREERVHVVGEEREGGARCSRRVAVAFADVTAALEDARDGVM